MEREQAISYMRDLLQMMADKKGSDLFISVGFPPAIKVDGNITPISKTALTSDNTRALAYAIMKDRNIKEFEATKECNFAISPKGIGRFRANAHVQSSYVGMILRKIETEVPTLEQLGLPEVLQEVSLTKRGLVVIVGGTGSGKSTSLAAMINHRNEKTQGHIITVEDPIEYVHPHKGCIIMQREVGMDTEDWQVALKNTLRQAPDVISLGEIRDRETMEMALQFAETGHLAIATLHANNANQAMDRIVNFFPEERRQQLLMDLSLNLRGVISQRLLKKAVGKGRVAAIELMLNSPLVSDLLLKGETHQIKEIMSKSNELGMKTFDQALFDLYEDGLITYEDALRNADSMNELRLRIKLEGKENKDSDKFDGLDKIELVATEDPTGMIY